jgi:hypothetical protein
MAFKIRTERRPVSTSGVTVKQVPEEFLAAMEGEYARVTADPTQEIILTGENAAETTLYLQYAKYWGNQHDPALLVSKLPKRKGDPELDARLSIVDKATATPRGRKVAAVETPAETPAPAPVPTPPAHHKK